jgi:hypothetical protein
MTHWKHYCVMKTLKSLAIHRHAFICTALLGALLAATPFAAVAQSPVLLRTFHSPTPAAGDSFGAAFAALGSDRLLVGAPYDDTAATNAGAVYLFHTNGTLLATFTNPPPFGGVGNAITTFGSDRVVIGSSGSVRLFTTNGALVSTISGPAGPGGVGFGELVAAFGNEKVLVGAPGASFDPDVYGIGAVFLYHTNGTLLGTYKNPDTNHTNGFGFCMAQFGGDRLIVGVGDYPYYDFHGGVYLFNTNGTLLSTITNPAPAADALFGASVVAVGTDRILVGAYGDDPLGSEAGSVYVYSTNGALLNTITNPAPAYGVAFGAQMALLGNDRLVITAPRDTATGFESGTAYVFDLNGTLLATINNPTPAVYDYFGWTLTTVGVNGVVIGAPYDDTGATNAGSAYLFSVPAAPVAPSLTIWRTTTNTVAVSWPSTATAFVLQQNTNGLNSVNWSNVTASVQTVGTNETLIVNPIGGSRFYRLVKP